MKRLFIISILVLSAHWLNGQSRMSSADISFLYNQNNEFLIDWRVAQQENEVMVFVRFLLNSGNVKIGDYDIRYDLRSSYIDEKHLDASGRLDSAHLIGSGFREFIYAFKFNKEPDQNLVVLDITNVTRDKKFMVDIPITVKEGMQNQPFLLFEEKRNIPFFSHFVSIDQSVRIVNVFGQEGKYEIQGVQNNKAVAPPPYYEGELPTPTQIPIDTLYGATENQLFHFSTPGFYMINEASAPENQMGILVTDQFYPFFGQYQELIQPLIFVSTTSEFDMLREATDIRDAFEGFVLNKVSTGGKSAEDFVKYYFRRVRKAAHFFTSDKEGWKTDRGMVYMIYGDPLQVFRNENTELWVYPSPNGGRTRFIFDLAPSKGNLLEFKLIRGSRYRDAWMEAVSDWRSGKIIEE